MIPILQMRRFEVHQMRQRLSEFADLQAQFCHHSTPQDLCSCHESIWLRDAHPQSSRNPQIPSEKRTNKGPRGWLNDRTWAWWLCSPAGFSFTLRPAVFAQIPTNTRNCCSYTLSPASWSSGGSEPVQISTMTAEGPRYGLALPPRVQSARVISCPLTPLFSALSPLEQTVTT